MNDAARSSSTHDDLRAIDAMLTAARDHACALADATARGSEARTRAVNFIRHLERVHAEAVWISIDAGLVTEIVGPRTVTAARSIERAA